MKKWKHIFNPGKWNEVGGFWAEKQDYVLCTAETIEEEKLCRHYKPRKDGVWKGYCEFCIYGKNQLGDHCEYKCTSGEKELEE